ncbi:sugar transferase [Mucilaginibacter sp. E4BP6]|uniref:sugar transferase n=1 Tax=Mucilaginibacter sp. E4BP6 TaxID=2723089 RepID=UPI0015CD7225|nr:sugar transferase [Mucilaginibacter sp. E4BP6]NYE67907.1 exopolysaccharide biosynthesis polyprenyl glycosylphosphotransferase [Mucilaginibacter sp. E4BP6]
MKYSRLLPFFIFISDFFILNIALKLAYLFSFTYRSSSIEFNNFLLLVNLVWVITSLFTKTYQLSRPLVLSENINKFSSALLYHLVIVLFVIYFFKLYEVGRVELVISYLMFFVLIAVERSWIFFTLDVLRKRGYNKRHIIVIGNEGIAKRLFKSFANHPEYGYHFIDFIDETRMKSVSSEVLFQEMLDKRPDEIFLCYKNNNQDLLKKLVDFGEEHKFKIKFVSDLVLDNGFASVINYENLPVIQLSSHPEISFRTRFFKRSFDILFSLFVMILGSPIFLIVALITKFTSKGPVFFRQERVGLNHKPFRIYKFRSMYVNAELLGPQLSSDNDPRITKWGSILRKSRLDELPQFWNVLKGDMSVVGPRPERQFFIEQLLLKSPNYKKLLTLKPGLTSIGQVNYGYAENIDQMRSRVRYDLIYLNNISFNSDMGIILKTIQVMAQLKGK